MRCKINRGGEGKPLVDTKTCDSINFFYILSPSFSYIIFANSNLCVFRDKDLMI